MISIELCKDLKKIQHILVGLSKYDSVNQINKMNHGKNIFAEDFVIGPPGSIKTFTSPKSINKDLKRHVEG